MTAYLLSLVVSLAGPQQPSDCAVASSVPGYFRAPSTLLLEREITSRGPKRCARSDCLRGEMADEKLATMDADAVNSRWEAGSSASTTKLGPRDLSQALDA